jgi:hypothetical protein
MLMTMSINNSEKQILNEIITLMQRDDSTDAPQDAIQWSKNLFRTRKAEQPAKSFVQRILAVLQMDLSPNQAAFGERSAGTGEARQMLFEAGENKIDLRIKEDEKGFTLKGQILGEGFANSTVKLNGFETKTNELSEFSFTEVPHGKYDLTLQSIETEITIENLEIK